VKRSEIEDQQARQDTFQVTGTWTFRQVRNAFRSVRVWFARRRFLKQQRKERKALERKMYGHFDP
jgi:hypothetical protein